MSQTGKLPLLSHFVYSQSTSTTLQSTVPSVWQSSAEVFILLRNEAAASNAEVEFSGENQMLRLKPVRWNERILCVKHMMKNNEALLYFPAGNVKLTVFSGGVALKSTQLQYYSSMEEITCLLLRVADPVDFMCQVKSLKGCLRFSLLIFKLHHADVPSLLHFAAQYGFRSVSSLLLQCPGADRALHTANRHGQTPTEIAKSHGHTELHVLLKETKQYVTVCWCHGAHADPCAPPKMPTMAMEEDGNLSITDVQKQQGGEDKEGEDEDLYAPLGMNDEYDTFLNSTKAVLVANRPPAPTPRPESTQVKESGTPYIAQVFQQKTLQSDADLYSLPTKQGTFFINVKPHQSVLHWSSTATNLTLLLCSFTATKKYCFLV
uniref:DBB domain-containing protein n=1 Tax=Amphiprion percula TaxID=161767 RepID=A0A3P8U504_AMPPE